MAKKQRRDQPTGQPGPTSSLTDEQRIQMSGTIHLCQRVLHGLTGIMIGAFLLIVLFTTFSTGAFVQVTGRGLYFLILAAAMLSFGTWILRVVTERRLGGETHVLAEILRKA